MKSLALTIAVAVFAFPFAAAAEEPSSSIEMAFVPTTMDVTLLNENGKFVTVDMKKIAKGEKCRMDKDSVIMKVRTGDTAGTTRVRYIAPQLSHGGCPFMTEFELSDADYTAARNAFTAKTDQASQKVEDLKRQLGEKWNEITGQKEKANP
jgi:hypothetical protein